MGALIKSEYNNNELVRTDLVLLDLLIKINLGLVSYKIAITNPKKEDKYIAPQIPAIKIKFGFIVGDAGFEAKFESGKSFKEEEILGLKLIYLK